MPRSHNLIIQTLQLVQLSDGSFYIGYDYLFSMKNSYLLVLNLASINAQIGDTDNAHDTTYFCVMKRNFDNGII